MVSLVVVSDIFLFSLLLGEDFQFDYYFSDGLKPPRRWAICFKHVPAFFEEELLLELPTIKVEIVVFFVCLGFVCNRKAAINIVAKVLFFVKDVCTKTPKIGQKSVSELTCGYLFYDFGGEN